MNQRFYLLNGLNDPSLKNTYVASLPEEIQPELNKMVITAQMDLDRHFQRMNLRFYLLDGLNDPSLKNTYVASLLEEIQPELNKMVAAAQMDFSTMSMGQIHQFTLEVVDKLCRQHQYFSDIMNRKAKYTRACRKPYLEIKCREKTCHCSPKKKKSYKLTPRGKEGH